ncbi:DUF1911 domain-containing protein [Oxalobacteraceae bacterium]|nr:DUF1911 domain-containing protein [Oxalobacteraceae bacterium]
MQDATGIMHNKPFHEQRRQQFLSKDLYEKSRANQFSMINVENDNTRAALRGSEGHTSAYEMIYLEQLWIWMLDYTAGTPIEDLAPRISGIVDAFEAWNEVDQLYQQEAAIEFPEYGAYQYRGAPVFSTLSDFEDTLQLLSISILLRDRHSIHRIIQVLRSHRGEDGLFEQLIGGYVDDEQALDCCVLGKPYSTLLQAFYAADEWAALEAVKVYLKQWYPAMKDHPRWYDGHLRIHKDGHAPYYGYWAFEAGATVYLLDLNDSTIEHLVYPKDLVDYARKLRDEDRYTSRETETLINAGRVEGGHPCPQTGFWETPARLHSRAHFEQGDIMPTLSDSQYGSTIWQWSTEQ